MGMDIKQLEKIALNALKKAYQIHQELGASGEELVQKNQFGLSDMNIKRSHHPPL